MERECKLIRRKVGIMSFYYLVDDDRSQSYSFSYEGRYTAEIAVISVIKDPQIAKKLLKKGYILHFNQYQPGTHDEIIMKDVTVEDFFANIVMESLISKRRTI